MLIDGILNADDYSKKKNQFEFEINQQKQKIISSTFLEKIIIQNKKCLTLKVNDLLQIMLLNNSVLSKIKKGQIN